GCPACAGPVCNNNSVMDNGETGIDCGGGGCPACPPPPAGPCASGTTNYRSPLSYCSIQELIQAATGWVLGLVSSIIILFLVYGGIMYTMAAGDETKMESAKNIIYYAILGLAIVLVSYTLITEIKTILKVK
ncbi:pilin, partial [Patescibacteria group bacterium]|nr:pilin [Patescibacteria group bacterium]